MKAIPTRDNKILNKSDHSALFPSVQSMYFLYLFLHFESQQIEEADRQEVVRTLSSQVLAYFGSCRVLGPRSACGAQMSFALSSSGPF